MHLTRPTAPTNTAFNSLPADALEYLLLPESVDRLRDVVLYHVVRESYATSDLPSGRMPTLKTKADGFLDFVIVDAMSESGIVTLNGHAHVILSEVFSARNGVVHAIDAVLLPDDVAALALDGMSTIATGDDVLVAGGGDDFLDIVFPDSLPPNNGSDDFFDVFFPLDDQHIDDGGVLDDDGGAHQDDASGMNDSDDPLDAVEKWDDFFDGFLSLDTIKDDNFPIWDDWDGIIATNVTADEESDQQVEPSDGDCFSDLMCCFLFLCG